MSCQYGASKRSADLPCTSAGFSLKSRLLISWQTHAVRSQPTPLLLSGGIHPRVLSQQIHSHEDVAVIKERAPQPGYAINLPAVRHQQQAERLLALILPQVLSVGF